MSFFALYISNVVSPCVSMLEDTRFNIGEVHIDSFDQFGLIRTMWRKCVMLLKPKKMENKKEPSISRKLRILLG